MNEQEIEQFIQDKGLNAPRLSPSSIDAVITSPPVFHRFPNTTVTVCLLELKNGFCVVGKSAAASLENFDEEIGQGIAMENARQQVWELEGYLLKQRLYEQQDR